MENLQVQRDTAPKFRHGRGVKIDSKRSQEKKQTLPGGTHMLKRIALSAGILFFLVTTIIAIFDYVRLLYRPVIEADWQLHYALLVSTPVDAVMLVYAQAVLDYFASPIPFFATAFGTALLVMLQIIANYWRDRQRRRAFAR
jgi:hypothetical protein